LGFQVLEVVGAVLVELGVVFLMLQLILAAMGAAVAPAPVGVEVSAG
jgi:hypothetical protein